MTNVLRITFASWLALAIIGGLLCETSLAAEPNVVTITTTKLEITRRNVHLTYEIVNNSDRDVWILAGSDTCDVSAGILVTEDDRTVLVRECLDISTDGIGHDPFYGRYVRLRAGTTQRESVSLALPVSPDLARRVRDNASLQYASRLIIEIGYFPGDLPAVVEGIFRNCAEQQRARPQTYPTYPRNVYEWFGGALGHNEGNEGLRDRDEEILIPYTDQAFKGEQTLRLTVEGYRIPYADRTDLSSRTPPDVTSCTRVQIRYEPSMFEYFFPFAGQQSLLSSSEKEFLRSSKTAIVDDRQQLAELAKDISKGIYSSGIDRQRTAARVLGYRGDKPVVTFRICNDTSVVTPDGYRFTYERLPSLRAITPELHPLYLRVRCGANLKDLWHRLRLCHEAERNGSPDAFALTQQAYPMASTWCEAMLHAYRSTGMLTEDIVRRHKCPSAGGGRCHYAMNPNCTPDSAGDMVLLFETKAGWNQHGGPELFTFDNHDPKGGCVLLIDGTVKFIRTEEELHALRWK